MWSAVLNLRACVRAKASWYESACRAEAKARDGRSRKLAACRVLGWSRKGAKKPVLILPRARERLHFCPFRRADACVRRRVGKQSARDEGNMAGPRPHVHRNTGTRG